MIYTLPAELIVSEWLIKHNVLAVFGDNSIPYREYLADPGPIRCGDFTIEPDCFVRCKQTHSDLTRIVSSDDAGAGLIKPVIPDVDGLITNQTGLFPMAVSADCTPILVLVPEIKLVGAVHSGRVGTEKNILGKILSQIINEYNVMPCNILIKTGASICATHYPVDEQTHKAFTENTGVSQKVPYIDIRKVLLKQAKSIGIPDENIEMNPICTFEHPAYSSYRENKTRQRQINFIGYPE
jgi:YfiH family protein